MVFSSCHKKDMFRRRGQLNIDYIFAFFILMLSVVYASIIIQDSIGPFYSSIDRNNLRAEAWIFSERLMELMETEDHDLDEALINTYVDNKTKLHDALDEKYRYRQKIDIDMYPVILTRDKDGYNHTGSAVFNKTDGPVVVNMTVRNMTTASYSIVDIQADNNDIGLYEGNTTAISGKNYTISKIDADGNFVILERTVLSYGWGSIEQNMVTVNRYSVLDGFIVRVKIMYF